jgi:hypothetical protein
MEAEKSLYNAVEVRACRNLFEPSEGLTEFTPVAPVTKKKLLQKTSLYLVKVDLRIIFFPLGTPPA